jgi:hypothetical protein
MSGTNTDGAWSFQLMDTATISRQVLGALLTQTGTAANSSWRPGVLAQLTNLTVTSSVLAYDLYVSQQGSPNMSVSVLPGSAVITRSGLHPYIAVNSTPRTVTIAASSPSLPRLDLVYYQIRDQAFSDAGAPGTGGVAVLDVVTGTPAGSPVLPALPANAIPLAQVSVAANATTVVQANITQLRKGTSVTGAPRLLLEGDALADAGSRAGESRIRYSSSYGTLLTDVWGLDSTWHGTTELELSAVPSGNIACTANTWNTVASIAIADPGWPYYIKADGQAYYSAGVNNVPNAAITLDSTSPPTGTIGATLTTVSNAADFSLAITGRKYPIVQTGAHTVRLLVDSSVAGTCFAALAALGQSSWLNVTLVPA